jgi:hypothetical protein
VQVGVKIELLLINLWLPLTFETMARGGARRNCFTFGVRVEGMGGSVSLWGGGG